MEPLKAYYCTSCKAQREEVARLRAEVERLRALCERLVKYSRHSDDCDKSYPAYSEFKVKCSCGLDTLRAAGRGEGEA